MASKIQIDPRMDEAIAKISNNIEDFKKAHVVTSTVIDSLTNDRYAKFVYTFFLQTGTFDNVSFSFLNPNPTDFRKEYIVPRDMFYKTYEQGLTNIEVEDYVASFPMPSLNDFISAWKNYNKPIILASGTIIQNSDTINLTQLDNSEHKAAFTMFDESKIQESSEIILNSISAAQKILNSKKHTQ